MIEPAEKVHARLTVPGDKSISHRALILNAVAGGRARIANLAPGDDVCATVDALRALGVEIERCSAGVALVRGGASWRAEAPVDCRNSGTTARLLLGVLASHRQASATLTGDDSLRRRPMKRVVDPLRAMGAQIDERGRAGRLPLTIAGRSLSGRAHRLQVPSAQLKSALLLAGLAAEGETSIEEPALSRDHTERMLSAMGARLARTEADAAPRIVLQPGPLDPLDVDVPGDFSSAAPFLALSAARFGTIVIEDVGLNPTRSGFLAVLSRMGAEVIAEAQNASDRGAETAEPRGTVRVVGGSLVAVEIGPDEVARMIDELPLVAVLATQAEGVTRVRGASELRVKESDRIAAIALGLRTMGARIETTADGFEIEGPTPLRAGPLDAAGDHRIVMALAVAAHLARGTSRLRGEEWVGVSFPRFFEELRKAAGAPRATGARA